MFHDDDLLIESIKDYNRVPFFWSEEDDNLLRIELTNMRVELAKTVDAIWEEPDVLKSPFDDEFDFLVLNSLDGVSFGIDNAATFYLEDELMYHHYHALFYFLVVIFLSCYGGLFLVILYTHVGERMGYFTEFDDEDFEENSEDCAIAAFCRDVFFLVDKVRGEPLSEKPLELEEIEYFSHK